MMLFDFYLLFPFPYSKISCCICQKFIISKFEELLAELQFSTNNKICMN